MPPSLNLKNNTLRYFLIIGKSLVWIKISPPIFIFKNIFKFKVILTTVI